MDSHFRGNDMQRDNSSIRDHFEKAYIIANCLKQSHHYMRQGA